MSDFCFIFVVLVAGAAANQMFFRRHEYQRGLEDGRREALAARDSHEALAEPPESNGQVKVRLTCACCKEQEGTEYYMGEHLCLSCQHAIEHAGLYLESPRFQLPRK